MAYIGQQPAKVALTSSDIGADIINADKIANDSISEEHIDNTAITGFSALTSLADTDKFLVSDASDSGNLKYVENQYLGGGTVKKITNAYFSTTRVATSFDKATIISSENFVAPTNGPVSWSFTKDESSTAIIFHFHFSLLNGSQCHASAIYKDDNSNFRRIAFDLGRNGGGSIMLSGVQYYTGLGTGSHTFKFSCGRSNDGANTSFIHNPDTNDGSDMSGATCSAVVVYEVST